LAFCFYFLEGKDGLRKYSSTVLGRYLEPQVHVGSWFSGSAGKWDWVANGVLMGAYHWHQPWGMAMNIVASVFLFALPARLFRSTWMAIIVHALQYLIFIPLILAIVLGLA